MSRRSKWLTMTAMLFGGATLFGNGCLGNFWKGFWNEGWPSNNRWLNLALDILNEDFFS